jgi:hypothetical protein
MSLIGLRIRNGPKECQLYKITLLIDLGWWYRQRCFHKWNHNNTGNLMQMVVINYKKTTHSTGM